MKIHLEKHYYLIIKSTGFWTGDFKVSEKLAKLGWLGESLDCNDRNRDQLTDFVDKSLPKAIGFQHFCYCLIWCDQMFDPE